MHVIGFENMEVDAKEKIGRIEKKHFTVHKLPEIIRTNTYFDYNLLLNLIIRCNLLIKSLPYFRIEWNQL